jgi:CubicO group peptidase (beta-lactamase class C family)
MGQNWTAEKQITDQEVLDLLKKEKAAVRAGVCWSYSNSAYVVLGLIIAPKVSSRSPISSSGSSSSLCG